MRRSFLPLLVISSLLLSAASPASSRPRYGGTVRVLLRHKIKSLDPSQESSDSATRDRIAALLYEGLTKMDAQGHARANLANSWEADSSRRVWQFTLRPAHFHDGTAMSTTSVATSLRMSNSDWKVTATGRLTVTVETSLPVPQLPELLALPRFAIIKRLPDGTLSGTGPFKLADWQPSERALLAANDDYWGGRPFPDAIEFRLGPSLREHLMERNLGLDHAADLGLDQLRAADQGNQNLLVSRPSELLVLVFLPPNAARKPVDPRVREALAWAINRTAINNVLLQKKGTPAGGLLPQWLTGYEFLFPMNQDTDRARKLRADAGVAPSLALAYDSSDPTLKAVAERIAVDAREAGITVQTFADPHANEKSARSSLNADAVLLRLPLSSLDAAAALTSLADDLALPPDIASAIIRSAHPEDLAEVERKALADFRVVPVAHVSEILWTNGNVHNWQQLPDGNWDFDHLWVEGSR